MSNGQDPRVVEDVISLNMEEKEQGNKYILLRYVCDSKTQHSFYAVIHGKKNQDPLLGKVTKKYEEALIHLLKAGEVMPNYSRVFYNLGQIQSYLGQIESAEKSFITAISIEPESFDYLYVLADFYLNQQMFEKSRAIVIKMNETFPGNRTGEQLLKKINENPL